MKRFRAAFPQLSQFLAAWFGDCTEPDDQIIDSYRGTVPTNETSALVAEIESCLDTAPFLGIEIAEESNRYLVNDSDAQEWIRDLLALLKDTR